MLKKDGGNKQLTYWDRIGDFEKPLAGFDCSGMILCAAQIAGLPYFFKNTDTLLGNLKPLRPTEELEAGDLVFYSGHVLVVSDLKEEFTYRSSGI